MKHLEIHQIDWLEHQRQVAGIGHEFLLGLGSVPDVDRKRDARMITPVPGDLLGQEIRNHGLGAGDGNVPSAFSRKIRDLALHTSKVRKACAIVVEKKLSGRVETYALRKALKELGAKLLLEPLHPTCERRGGQVHVFRRFSDGARSGDSLYELKRV